MAGSKLVPLMNDLPLSSRSDEEILAAIDIELKGLKSAIQAFEEAARSLDEEIEAVSKVNNTSTATNQPIPTSAGR